MFIKKSIKILVISLAFLVLPVAIFAAVPQFPHLFYGTLTINNEIAKEGITINAFVGDTKVGSISTTEEGKYGGPNASDSKLVVQGDIENGDAIKFLIGNTEAEKPAFFASGEVEELDLSFSLPSNQEIVSNNTTATIISKDKPELVITNNEAALSTINVPSAVTNPSINYSAIIENVDNTNKVTITNDLSVEVETSRGDVALAMPENLEISGPTDWNGVVNLPTVKGNSTVTLPSETNIEKTVDSVIEIGFDDTVLTFNKPVRILFAGKAGKHIGYSRNNGFTPITTTCNTDNQASVDGQLDTEGDCKINSGSDLVIWTKHFTKFVTYTQTDTTPPANDNNTGGTTTGDTVAPSISGINVTAGSNTTMITWDTNESSLTWLVYGTSTAYGQESKSTSYHTSHSVTLNNLLPGTTYHYQIKSRDSSGNIGSYADRTFTTLALGVGEAIVGDINNDNKTDIFDFNLLMVNWGDTPTNLSADLNNDEKVDIFDFNLLMVNWTL